MRTDEAIVSDTHVGIAVVDVVVRQDCYAEGDGRVLADVNPPWIRLVELGAHGDGGALPDIHAPHSNEVLPTQDYHDVP